MDTSVVTTPLARAWGLLAELATYTTHEGHHASLDEAAQRVADLTQMALPCPWGAITLQIGAASASASWNPPAHPPSLPSDGISILSDDLVELPISLAGEVIGMMRLGMSAEAREIVSAGFVAALRSQIELLIDIQQRRAQATNRADQHTTELTALQRASQLIAAALSADDLIAALDESAKALASFDAIEICLYHPQSQTLAIALSRGIRHRSDHSRTYRVGDGLVGWVARHRRTLRLEDVRSAPVRSHVPSLQGGHTARSYLGLPLLSDDRLIGTIELFSQHDAHFSANAERLLAIPIAQAAQALAGMQRHEQVDEYLNSRMRQLRALQRISRELTATLYLHNILGFALDEALRATHADCGYIALLGYQATQTGYDLVQEDVLGVTPTPQVYIALTDTGSDRAMRIIAVTGYAQDELGRLINQPLQGNTTIAEQSVTAGEAQIVDETTGDDRPFATGPVVAAVLAVPIYYEAQVIGVINLHSQIPFTFDRDALDFVRAVADQVALAIGNEQRWTEQRRQRDLLQQRANTLNEVLRIGQELRADRSLEDVLEQIAFSIIETTGFRAVVFYLLDTDAQQMQLITGAGLSLPDLERLRSTPFLASTAQLLIDPQFQIGRCFYIPGASMRALAPGRDLIDGDPAISDEGWQPDDGLYVPLYGTRGQMIGILAADEPYDRQRPTRRSVESLEIFADQAALAVENATLLGEAREQADQMTALYRASTSAAGTLELDELLEQTYREIETYMGVPSFMYIATYDQLHATTRFEIFKREGQILASYHKVTVPKSGWTGYVIDTGEVLHVRDAADEAASLPTTQPVLLGEMVRSYLGIPLLSQGQVIGVLSIQSFNAHAFSGADVQFLSTLANQLVVAIEKVKLFQEREQRIEELNIINRIAQITISTRDVAQILNDLYDCLASFLKVDAFYGIVYQDDRNEIAMGLFVDDGVRDFARQSGAPDPGSMTEWILNNRRPLRFDDLRAAEAQTQFKPTTFGNPERHSASWLGVPLLVGEGTIIGVLSVQSYTPGCYGDREEAFMTTVASQVALGIQNVLLLNQAHAQVRQLALVNRVSATAAATLDVSAVFNAAMDAMAQASGADQARLLLYEGESKSALLMSQYATVPQQQTIVIDLADHPLVSWVDQHRQPYLSFDVQSDPMFALWSASYRKHDIRSVLLVPLVAKERVIGAVRLDYVGRQYQPSERELELSQTIANQTAIALENARLFGETQLGADQLEHKVGELSALLEAARVLSSSLQPRAVLDSLMDVVRRQLQVNTVALWENAGDGTLLPVAMLGIPEDVARTIRVPIGRGLTGRVAAMGEPLVVADVENQGGSLYPSFNRNNNYTSFMGVPVRYRDKTIGVLSVMTTTLRRFSGDEVQLLSGMADQAAIALENAHLFEEREQRIAELSTLNRISQTINGTLDLDELLHALHAGIGDVLDTSISFIGLYDRYTRRLWFPIARDGGVDYQDDEVIIVNGTDTLAERLIIERKSILLNTLADVEAHEPTPPEQGPPRIASYIGTPIILGQNVLGMITIQSEEANVYTSDDLRFVETVASQAATAIGNARLFLERERRLREVSVLQEIGTAITSTLDLQTILERLHTQIGRVIDVGTSSIVLYDTEQDVASYPVAYDLGQRVEVEPGTPIGPSGWVIRKRQPLLIHTSEDFDQLNFPGEHIGPEDQIEESFLAVPIMSGDEVLGVIDIQSYSRHAFGRDDLQFLVTVASQAAVAITNARLFLERGRRIEELATLNEIGQELNAVTSQEALLDLLHRQVRRLLNGENSFIALYDERSGEISFPIAFEEGQRYQIAPLKIHERNSLTGHVAQTRTTLVINGNVDSIAEQQGIKVFKYGNRHSSPRSWVGVPMIVADKVVGVIAIQDLRYENAYSSDDVRLMETIASWGATALENARLISESRQSIRELTALYDASVQLTSTLDPVDIQTTAASSVLELVGVDACIVTSYGNRHQLRVPAVVDLGPQPIQGDEFASAAARLVDKITPMSPLLIADLTIDAPDLVQMTGLLSLVAVPVVSRDLQVGVIWAGRRVTHEWQEREISLLSIFASQLSEALARAQLLVVEQERRRVADTLRETAQMFTRLRTQEGIFELIFDQLARVLTYDTASLLLRDGNMLRVSGGRGFAPDARITELAFSLSEDANLRQVFETKRPMVLSDARESPYFVIVKDTEHIRGWIAVPLLVDDEVIGLICIDSQVIGAYTEEDGEIAFALASQAAQAIRNARLYAEVTELNAVLEERVSLRTAQLQEEQDRLRAVHAITIELTATLELQPTLNRALELAAHAVGARRGSIMLRDMQGDALTCRAVLGVNGVAETTDIPINFMQGGGLVGWVMLKGEAVCIADVREDLRWVREEGRADDVRSIIAAPLLTQDGPLGVLMLSSPRVDFFRDVQVQLLTTIANEIAIVIHNATLYNVISDLALERGNSEAQQREENSKNQAILQSLGEGVIVLDEQQQVVLFNPAAEKMLGIPASFVTGQALRYLLQYPEAAANARADQIYDGLNQGLQALAEQPQNHSRMLTLQVPTQTIVLNFAVWVGPRGAIYGSVVVLRDVTREIESDRAKREFISSVSHELRTPLTSIKGYIDLLLLGAAGPLQEGQLAFLNVVKNNANRLMDLINDILEIGRIDSEKIQLNFEQTNIGEIFQDVLQTLRVQIERKQMSVQVDVADDLPEVTADVRRLTQVILNLSSNAVKYTFPEGQITLRSFLNPAGMMQVDVVDTGVGISAEDQKNLFRRFQRFDNPLRDEAGGTGLGLSIAKSFVELHGGEMWVESEQGHGSTFSFIIPVAQPEPGDQNGIAGTQVAG